MPSFYAVRNEGQPQTTVFMVRVIMDTPKGLLCDHICHETLDNQRENLRNVTRFQNQQNRRIQRSNTTGFKGVSLDHNKYRANIRVDGKPLHLGNFTSAEEASAAYEAAAKKYFGDFRYQA